MGRKGLTHFILFSFFVVIVLFMLLFRNDQSWNPEQKKFLCSANVCFVNIIYKRSSTVISHYLCHSVNWMTYLYCSIQWQGFLCKNHWYNSHCLTHILLLCVISCDVRQVDICGSDVRTKGCVWIIDFLLYAKNSTDCQIDSG